MLEAELAARIEDKARAAISERILREAGFERQVADTLAAITKPDGATLAKDIAELFEREPDREWRDHIVAVADAKTKAD